MLPKEIGDYAIDKKVGSGTFGSVWQGYHKTTGTKVAIKVVSHNHFSNNENARRFLREVEYIKQLDHPLIAEFYELQEDDQNYYMIMEYVENGNLLEFVNANGELDESRARHYFCELVSVLEYLHDQMKIAHRDLKAENVLFDRHNNIRLIDFGLSNMFTDENPFLSTACGSPSMFFYACTVKSACIFDNN